VVDEEREHVLTLCWVNDQQFRRVGRLLVAVDQNT
jgi:hypothetical protein